MTYYKRNIDKNLLLCSPHLSRLAQQIVDLLADIVDAGGDMGSQRKKNTDELLQEVMDDLVFGI